MGAVQCGDFDFTAVKKGKLKSHMRAVHEGGFDHLW